MYLVILISYRCCLFAMLFVLFLSFYFFFRRSVHMLCRRDCSSFFFFFFSSRRRHTRCSSDWSSDVCSSDLCTDPESLAPRDRDVGGVYLERFTPARRADMRTDSMILRLLLTGLAAILFARVVVALVR